jgi:hypothetical protein
MMSSDVASFCVDKQGDDDFCDFEVCLQGSAECQTLLEATMEVCGDADYCELEPGDECCTAVGAYLEIDCPQADIMIQANKAVATFKQDCEDECDTMRSCAEVYCKIMTEEDDDSVGSGSALSVLALLAVVFLRL